jgi:nucleoside-diphosphate-sugar epimerase
MTAFEKVAVTGGSGNLGAYVVDKLKRSCDVTIIDVKTPRDASVSFEEVDILDLARVAAALQGHDAVIHLSAINQPVPRPMEVFFQTNVVGTWNVLTAAELAGCASQKPKFTRLGRVEVPVISGIFGHAP